MRQNGKTFLVRIFLSLIWMTMMAGCSRTVFSPTPTRTPQQTRQSEQNEILESETTVIQNLDQPKILYFSEQGDLWGWYAMNPDGADVVQLEFPNLVDYEIRGIKWIPELGNFIVVLEDKNFQEDLFIIDANGDIIQRLTNDFYGEARPDYSQSNSQFVFTCVDVDLDICTVNVEGKNFINLTLSPSRESYPLWSPAGETIVFLSTRSAVPGIWLVNKDGQELRQLNLGMNFPEEFPSWSPDGEKILFQSKRDENWEIYVVDPSGENSVNLTNHPDSDIQPMWSPDGNYIGFLRESEGGSSDIFIMKADGTGLINVSNTSDIKEREFIWSLDGQQIIFVSPEEGNLDIFKVNIDGSNKTKLTSNPGDDLDIQWIGH